MKKNKNEYYISKWHFNLIQFFRKYSYIAWPVITGLLFSIMVFICYFCNLTYRFAVNYSSTFIGGLFTLIGFSITMFTIMVTVNKKFYGNHITPLCKNIVFCIIFSMLGIISSFLPKFDHIFISGFTLMALTNFIILLRYIYYTIKHKINNKEENC